MSFELVIGIGLLLGGALLVVIIFYIGLSRPVKDVEGQPRYQYFSERSRRSGRFKQKK